MWLENVTFPANCVATFPVGGLTAASSLLESPAASPRVVMIWKSRMIKFQLENLLKQQEETL